MIEKLNSPFTFLRIMCPIAKDFKKENDFLLLFCDPTPKKGKLLARRIVEFSIPDER